LFVFHKWRDQDDRDIVLKHLDAKLGFKWRNFSNVWYDPIIRATSPEGVAALTILLEKQISPIGAAIYAAASSADAKDSDMWFSITAGICREKKIPIIGVLNGVAPEAPELIRKNADIWVPLDQLMTTVDQVYKGARKKVQATV